jgi:hypothetical protein
VRGQRGYRIDSPEASLIGWFPEGHKASDAKSNAELAAKAPELAAILHKVLRFYGPAHNDPGGMTAGGMAILEGQALLRSIGYEG